MTPLASTMSAKRGMQGVVMKATPTPTQQMPRTTTNRRGLLPTIINPIPSEMRM